MRLRNGEVVIKNIKRYQNNIPARVVPFRPTNMVTREGARVCELCRLWSCGHVPMSKIQFFY